MLSTTAQRLTPTFWLLHNSYVQPLDEAMPLRNYHSSAVRESTMSVTGPSFTSSTCIIAPNSPSLILLASPYSAATRSLKVLYVVKAFSDFIDNLKSGTCLMVGRLILKGQHHTGISCRVQLLTCFLFAIPPYSVNCHPSHAPVSRISSHPSKVARAPVTQAAPRSRAASRSFATSCGSHYPTAWQSTTSSRST